MSGQGGLDDKQTPSIQNIEGLADDNKNDEDGADKLAEIDGAEDGSLIVGAKIKTSKIQGGDGLLEEKEKIHVSDVECI